MTGGAGAGDRRRDDARSRRANIELVGRVYETAVRGAAEEMLALMDDDIRIVLPPALPYGGTYRGKAAVRDLGLKLVEAWSEFRYEVLHYTSGGDYVTAVIELQSIARASGREVRMPIAEVFRLRGGRVLEIQAFYFDAGLAARAFEMR
jgi:ketosteroid isomerase-like protein